MDHRDSNLVHTDIAWIDKNSLRRSPRLINKNITPIIESDDSLDNTSSNKIKRIKIKMGDTIYVDHEFNSESMSSETVSEEILSISEDIGLPDDLIESDDIMIDESEEEIVRPKKRDRSSEDDHTKPKKRQRHTQEFLDRKSYLQNEDWFKVLSIEDKNIYTQKILDLEKPTIVLPSIKDIIDLPLERSYIKELIEYRNNLDFMDVGHSKYDRSCEELVRKMNFYQNNNNADMLKKFDEFDKNNDTNPLLYRIHNSKFNDHVKSLLYDKYTKYCKNKPENAEDNVKQRDWMETVLALPHDPKQTTDIDLNTTISNMVSELNNQIYGMKEVKNELLCMIVNMINNPSSKFKAIGLSGPPGIGKTMLANIIADALKLPIARIAMGGITDSSFLEGHSFTYLGSEPGYITKSVIRMGCTNGIIFFDEIDKIPKTDKGNEIEYALLHITDFTQNHDYRDKFIVEVPINLSNNIFIYSMNDERMIDPTLRSRIPIFHFDGYTSEEKIELVQRFLLPEILKNYDLSDVTISTESTKYLINKTHEEGSHNRKSGVRSLKNNLNKIISRINAYRWLANTDGKVNVDLGFTIKDFKFPFVIKKNLINQILEDDAKKEQLSYFS